MVDDELDYVFLCCCAYLRICTKNAGLHLFGLVTLFGNDESDLDSFLRLVRRLAEYKQKKAARLARLFRFQLRGINLDCYNEYVMGLFGSKKHEVVLAIEITSGGVAGAFVLLEKSTPPLVVATVRRDFPLREERDVQRMRGEIPATVTELVTELHRVYRGRPTSVRVFLGAPFAHGEMRTAVYEKAKEFAFSEKLARSMMRSQASAPTKASEHDTVIDERVVTVALNGFTVDRPHGISCRTASVEAFFTFSSKALLDEIRDAIHRVFKARISFSGSLMSGFVAMRDIAGLHDALIIDIGAEATEVLLIQNGQSAGTAWLPSGERVFMRDTARMLGKGLVETSSLFALMTGGSLDTRAASKAMSAFDAARSQFRDSLAHALTELAPSRRLPQRIVMLSHQPIATYLADVVSPRGLPEFTAVFAPEGAIIADMKALHGTCRFSDATVRDPRIGVLAIFLARAS